MRLPASVGWMAVVDLGELKGRGGTFSFRPSGERAIGARPGEVLEITLRYDWKEGSARREAGLVMLTVEGPGGFRDTVRVRLRDRPIVEDQQSGVLRCRVSAPGRPLALTFTVEALYRETSWVGLGAEPVREFREKGSVRLAPLP